MKIKAKIILLSSLILIAIIVPITITITINSSIVKNKSDSLFKQISKNEAKAKALDVYRFCSIIHSQLGVKGKDLDEIKKAIYDMKVGESGYVFALGGKGEDKGNYIISYNGTRNGENIWNAQDANKKYFVRSMVNNALKLKAGEVGFEYYDWKNKGDSNTRKKIAATCYFAPWDWVIGAGLYEDDLKGAVNDIDTSLKSMLNWVLLFSFIFLFIGCGLSYFLASSISKPIIKMTNLAQQLSKGDLSSNVNIKSGDEIGEMSLALNQAISFLKERAQIAEAIAKKDLTGRVELASEKDTLGKSFKQMIIDLKEFITNTRNVVSKFATGTIEINEASQSLSQGATDQAASLEEISSSMMEITSQTKTNAENAVNANDLTVMAQEEAVRGGKNINEMLKAMEEINDSSKQIAQIIKTIDDIAFQTNILALNAAVEAARAGIHGKGFAVVAEEVRTLAGRSAKAAAETANLIEQAKSKVENGQEVASRTNQSINRIVDGIQKITEISSRISEASNDQAKSIPEINSALIQVGNVTQQNTANAEETTSSIEDLSSQAQKVSNLLNTYELE